MNSFEDLIKRVVKVLNDAKIEYMFTGALAVSYYGVPRTTVDVDIVAKLSLEDIKSLTAQLRKAGLRVNERKIEAAFKYGFKIVTFEDKKTPFTLDIIISDIRLEKKKGKVLGLPTYYQTPEALILAKLRMIKATIPKERALKDKDDVKAILKYARVNLKMLKERATKEKTISILEELLSFET